MPPAPATAGANDANHITCVRRRDLPTTTTTTTTEEEEDDDDWALD